TNFLGRGIGRNVKVLGFIAQNQVTHCAANNKRIVALLLQHFANFDRVTRDQTTVNLVLLLRVDPVLGFLGRRSGKPADEGADRLFAHVILFRDPYYHRKGHKSRTGHPFSSANLRNGGTVSVAPVWVTASSNGASL